MRLALKRSLSVAGPCPGAAGSDLLLSQLPVGVSVPCSTVQVVKIACDDQLPAPHPPDDLAGSVWEVDPIPPGMSVCPK